MSPELINSVAIWSWLENTGYGPVAFLLLAHPDDGAEARMLGLADALGLAAPSRPLPDVGERVTISGGTRAVVCLDDGGHRMEVTVGRQWAAFVEGGGPVALLVGLGPLPRRAPRAEVEDYLAVSALADRLRLGTANRRLTAV